MSEQRLIDANSENIFRVDPDAHPSRMYACGWNGMVHVVEQLPTIDPETLPIVQELRANIAILEEAVKNNHNSEDALTIMGLHLKIKDLREKLAEYKPVVYCKDCVNLDRVHMCCVKDSTWNPPCVELEDFCSYGKKKGEEVGN